MKKTECKSFEKYNEIADTVKECIETGDCDQHFLRSISQMDGHEEFLNNIASEETFKEAVEQMNEAQMNINTEKLLGNIRKSEKRRMSIQRRAIVTSLSVASALIAVCFFIYAPKESNVAGENKEIAEAKNTPILIVGDSVVEITKNGRRIVATDYIRNVKDDNKKKAVIQRLIIPSGQTYTVLLEDGSEVKLNACSELTYPSFFSGDSREVTLKGEAYFDVTKSDKPFIVNVDKSYVKVYGTSFNVDATTENEIKTILVEGRVGVGAEGVKEIVMTPNHLVTIYLKEKNCDIKRVDVENYIGWKSGYFKCIDNGINNLINDISSWYGVDFKYDKNEFSDFNVTVSISRNIPINETLKYVEDVTGLKFIKKQDKIYGIEK